MSQLLRKLLVLLAGLVAGSFPPEALVMLMEPPPGKGRVPAGRDPVPNELGPAPSPRRRHRPRVHRTPRHDH